MNRAILFKNLTINNDLTHQDRHSIRVPFFFSGIRTIYVRNDVTAPIDFYIKKKKIVVLYSDLLIFFELSRTNQNEEGKKVNNIYIEVIKDSIGIFC